MSTSGRSAAKQRGRERMSRGFTARGHWLPVPLSSAIFVLAAGGLPGALPAWSQTRVEIHAVGIRGGDSDFNFTGLAGGGGVLVLGNRLGVSGEAGLIADNSDERVLVPVISGGVSVHFPNSGNTRKLIPFLGTGFTAIGDDPGWYGGGGLNWWFHRRTALRLEFRAVPSAASGYPRNAWFLRAGLSFGVKN